MPPILMHGARWVLFGGDSPPGISITISIWVIHTGSAWEYEITKGRYKTYPSMNDLG